jgi:cupin 2 domain-containing protein
VSSPFPGHLFHLPSVLPSEELFTPLLEHPHVRIERIVSSGQTTPPGQWYDQAQDEWVIVLQGAATLTYDDGNSVSMQPGDYVMLPAHTRHRVDFTSQEPPCIWLAIHLFTHAEAGFS